MSSSAFEALKEYIDGIWVVDTHEHTANEEDWCAAPEGNVDFTRFFIHYANVDLISAGMPIPEFQKMMNHETPLDDKWELFEPYWNKSKTTAYSKSVETVVQDLFELPGLNRDTYKPLAAKMRELRKPGYYKWILKDKARIAISVLNTGMDRPDPQFFRPVACLDHFTLVRTRDAITHLEREAEMSIYSLDDLVEAMGKVFHRKIERGAIGIKTPMAYSRTLYVEHPSKPEAENAFNTMLTARGWERNDGIHGLCAGEGKVLQDYMFHKLVQLCVENDVPMQIHTGIQEGNGNYLAQSNPVLLNEVFMRYPKARFDIFHAGYPYAGELGVLAKMFSGVHADLCWMNIISPLATRRILSEWLEVVPSNKIFAFGGDYCFVEGAYSHAKFARKNVAMVLAEKVDEGYFTLEEAKVVADRVLRENAKEFFRLDI